MTILRFASYFIASLGVVASAAPTKGAVASFVPTKTSEITSHGTAAVATFPSGGIGVAGKNSLRLEFGPAPLTAKFAAARLRLPFAGERGDVSVVLDVYLEPEGNVAAKERESRFLGSRVARIRDTNATLVIPLSFLGFEPELARPFRLRVVTSGVSRDRPILRLTAAPTLEIATAPQLGHGLPALLSPLWTGTEVVDEAVMFLKGSDGVARARLLHPARKIEAVYSYAANRAYTESVDWAMEPDGVIRALPGSAIPVIAESDLYPPVAPAGGRFFALRDGRKLVYVEGWNYARTLWVSYRAEKREEGPRPKFAAEQLARSLTRLRRREPFKVVFFGDSITYGSNASAQLMKPPYLPVWADLVVAALKQEYGGSITARNRAVGGTTSDWGAKNVAALVASEKPDLCVIAFGMNDRSAGMAPAVFASNIRAIMESVREQNPAADFILVASMVNNPDWGPVQPLFAYRKVLLHMVGPGVAVADLTAIHRYLLTRKDYIAMSNNNLNHPNDYLVRWYAQVIGALLIPGWSGAGDQADE